VKTSVPLQSLERNSSSYGPTHAWIDQIPILVDRILPDPKPHALHNRQHPRLLPRRRPALELARLHQLALDRKHALFHSARLHNLAVPRREARYRPLAHPVRRVDAARIRRFDHVLADDVEDALAALAQVAQTVLGPVPAAAVADREDGRVVVHDAGVAEGREVRRRAVARPRRDEPDGPRDDAADQQLVVEGRGPSGLVRVDGNVIVLRPGGVVGAVAGAPGWSLGLRELETAVLGPGIARGFDGLEVAVRVALDNFFRVGHVFVRGLVFAALLGVGGHRGGIGPGESRVGGADVVLLGCCNGKAGCRGGRMLMGKWV